VGKPEGKTQKRKPGRRWEDDIKVDIREIGDRLCGLVVKVTGYRFRGPGPIPGATRFFSEK
jgi:hypothetical protein